MNWMAFFEMFVVFGFALGWAVLELVGLRLDKRRAEEAAKAERDERGNAEEPAAPG